MHPGEGVCSLTTPLGSAGRKRILTALRWKHDRHGNIEQHPNDRVLFSKGRYRIHSRRLETHADIPIGVGRRLLTVRYEKSPRWKQNCVSIWVFMRKYWLFSVDRLPEIKTSCYALVSTHLRLTPGQKPKTL